MTNSFVCDRILPLLALLLALLLAPFAHAADGASEQEQRQDTQAQRQDRQPGNNAPMWRDVRNGENPYQTTQVRGVETNILVQPAGETWRQIRNGPITLYGGLLLIAVPLLIFCYFRWKGPIRLHTKPTGRLIERFSDWERIVHWTTAISFVILAVSGIIILFGKYVILPMFGYTLFSWLAILGKNLHNFVGPLFVFCTLVMFVTFVKDNVWQRIDFNWVAQAGGLLNGKHVPSGRYNAGEKAWFWFGVTFLGLVSGATGLVLDFPNFDQGRSVMQLVNVVHGISAVLFIALAFSHIYIGTIGAEGAYESMRLGLVDEAWAKEHHEIWYEEVKASKARQHFADDIPVDVKAQVVQATKA